MSAQMADSDLLALAKSLLEIVERTAPSRRAQIAGARRIIARAEGRE